MTRRQITFGEPDAGEPAPVPRKRPDTGLDITPMIDVTFLLLIFFMVTSAMQQSPDVDVPAARHGVGVEGLSATVVTIRAPADPSAAPVIVLGDGRGETGDLDDVRRHVEEGLAREITQVIIKADRDVPHGFVQQVARAVTSVEGVQFFIGVQEKQ